MIQSEKINKNKINTNVNAESGLQNENNNINNENVQKATYSNIIEEHDGIKHRKNKIKNKKTKNQKVTNTAIISNQNVSSPAWLDKISTRSHKRVINATTFKKHIDQVRIFLCDNLTYDLFGVVETKLDPCISDDVIQVRGFKVFRKDRNLDGGGVALYVL